MLESSKLDGLSASRGGALVALDDDPRLTLGLHAQASSDADRVAADRVGKRLLPNARDGRGMERTTNS
jgi:hypothetical protein